MRIFMLIFTFILAVVMATSLTYEQFANDYFPGYVAALRADAERLTHRARTSCTFTDQCDACNDGHWD